jgi:tetratricopeptide (TPR) repeat protein
VVATFSREGLVQSRSSVYLAVAAAALVAAGIVVGLTLDTRTTPHQPKAASGKPPVPQGLPGEVGSQIESAFRNWPHGSITTMQRLGLQYGGGRTPKAREQSAIVQYYRGVALLWAGYPSDAQTALESAKRLGRNTIIQGRADNLLHPNYFQPSNGPPYPVFIPLTRNSLLEQGSRLQQQGHQISAERMFARAATKQPGNVEAQVAKAVGLFDEDNLTPAFSHLGPLSAKYPRSQVVHYYLGYLLAWTAQGQQAISQFEKTVKLGPTTEVGKAAKKFLEGIAGGSAG